MNTIYQNQDRGGKKEYEQYLEAMDAISIEKVASASSFFEPKKGNVIVDVGMASGTSSAILAKNFPELNIVGVDINPKMVELARAKYQLQNLQFREDDGETLHSFELGSVNGFFNCSSIHHITSYNGYDINRAYNTLQRQTELLAEDGVIVVRDFVKPDNKEIILELSCEKRVGRPNDCELLIRFSGEARSLTSSEERGFPLSEIWSDDSTKRKFKLFLSDATEFIRRKDYFANWEVELQEEYGYFSQQDFERIFRDLGLQIVVSAPIYNRWIINNRYKGQFRLFDLSGKEIGFPPTNYLIAGKKVKGGKQISLVRHLPPAAKPFLQYSSYQNQKNGEIYDLAQRPNEVADILPYFKLGDEIYVFAKQNYPRPLVSMEIDSPNIDKKQYSGYITECLTIGKTENWVESFCKRFGVESNNLKEITPSLTYYTSPGGIDEKVSSYLLELNSALQPTAKLMEGFSGFSESGTLNGFEASQLLNISQTGSLPEARLELNIYRLFHRHHYPLPPWLGEKFELAEKKDFATENVAKLLAIKDAVFEPSSQSADFMKSDRASFSELGKSGSSAVFEYVSPVRLSNNTLVTLPICAKEGKIFVALELRDLPVPQLHSDNCKLLTVPAKRLSKEIQDFFSLERYIQTMKIGESSVSGFWKLGEKYFSSVGITPEQVYPYVVCLENPTQDLHWVEVDELMQQVDRIEDAHLLIALYRLKHALAL